MIIFEIIIELILEFADEVLSGTKVRRWLRTVLLIIVAIFLCGLFLLFRF